MPPPRLKPASGWYVITTGPKSPPTAPSVLAATIPVRRDPGGAAALQHSTIDALPPGGIVVQAGNYGRQKMANSPVRRPPLTIRGAQIRRCFEGISCRHAYAVLLARVHGWNIEVWVWFAGPHPARAQRARADAEVRRLILPH
jgi:hypothetical protein